VVAPLYTYDANKNVTGETTGGGSPTHPMAPYSYTAGQDAEDRLIDWERGASGGGEERDWDLTLVGDWDEFTRDEDGAGGPLLPIVQPRNHTDAHEVDDIDGTPADHDPKGNMTDDGAVTGGGVGGSRTFAWDFDNRLTSVTMPDGKVHRFTYDALGRRVSKKVDTGSMGGGPYVETVYVCATSGGGLGQVVAEYIKGQPATNPERHFVYGAYVDEPLAFLAPSAQSLAPKYLHRNRKYDIVGITGTAGAVLERYTYTPYGEVTILDPTALVIRTESAVDNPYAYTGRRWEPETGLYYFRARCYGPKLGRFLGRDPLGYVDGYSLYAGYFAWLQARDPSGTALCNDRCPQQGQKRLTDLQVTLLPAGKKMSPKARAAGEFVYINMQRIATFADMAGLGLAGLKVAMKGPKIAEDIAMLIVEAVKVGVTSGDGDPLTANLKGWTHELATQEGVSIWVYVDWEECHDYRCCIFWRQLDWKDKKGDWYRCGAAGNTRRLGFAVDDAAGISKATSLCVRRAIRKIIP